MAISSGVPVSNWKRWRLPMAGLLVLVAAATAAYRYWSAPRPNIVFVTFDTTRADRLGAYGYGSGGTAGFDEIVKRGVVFEHAYAPAPVTLPSHATMLTGLYPPEHGLRVNGVGKLSAEIPVLPEILQENGYETGAFIAAVVLDSMYGLDRGFDVYDDNIPRSAAFHGERRRDGTAVVDAALNWLEERESRPFFCWIHLFDAHAPYDPRAAAYGSRFSASPYDAGVAWEVEQFIRVTAFLKERGLDSNTLVVVAGDHGEGLDEHLEYEHGMLVYNTTLHVPFAFVGACGGEPGTRVAEPVSLVDLTPTLLDLLQIPRPPQLSGRSLLPALRGEALQARNIYAETQTPFVMNGWAPLHAVISGQWKYIDSTRPELYDLAGDPGELTNLVNSAVDEREHGAVALAAMQNSFAPVAASKTNLSETDLANLRGLGYVAGSAPAEMDGDGTARPDVKDFLPLVARFERAKHLGMEGKLDDSIALLQEIVQSTDEFPAAELMLGDFLAQAGRLDDAAAAYRNLLARRPDFVRTHFTLGKVLASQGRLDEAAAEYRAFIQKRPEEAAAHYELAQVLAQQGKLTEAVAEHRAALQHAPEFVAANIALGQLLAAMRQPGEGAACLERALAYDPQNAQAHASLLIILGQAGQLAKAIPHGEQAVALEPESFEYRFNLGAALIAIRRYEDGIAQLREAAKLRPEDPRPAEQIQAAAAAMARRTGR